MRDAGHRTLRKLGVLITITTVQNVEAPRATFGRRLTRYWSKVFKTVITKSVRLEIGPADKESIFKFAPGWSSWAPPGLPVVRGGNGLCSRVGSCRYRLKMRHDRALRRGAGQFRRNAHWTAGDPIHQVIPILDEPLVGHGRPV